MRFITVRRVSADGGEEHRCQSEVAGAIYLCPSALERVLPEFHEGPTFSWLQVQIGFPLCSCSTLHLHEVQTSGFNVNRVDFKLNSSLCLCVYEYVCVWNNLSRIFYCFPKSFISFAFIQFILVWNTQSVKSLVSCPVPYSTFRTYCCLYVWKTDWRPKWNADNLQHFFYNLF